MTDLDSPLVSEVVRLVDGIRSLQATNGAVVSRRDEAARLLDQLINLLEDQGDRIAGLDRRLALATIADLRRWAAEGVETPPVFDATLDAFPAPENGAPVFLLACMQATNGPQPCGHFLEVISGYRRESSLLRDAESMTGGYVKAFDCIHLAAGSRGFLTGNCIVLFPESIATRTTVTRQPFALFFFNKFRRIYLEQTIPEVRRLFGERNHLFPDDGGDWLSATMPEPAMYDARCLWGYLHDFAHHTGPRPLDQSLRLKCRWHTGLLEELKCDLITALTAEREKPPYWREIIEFVLWERMLRYPQAPEDRDTFDAGSGVLLFHELVRNGAIREADSGDSGGARHARLAIELGPALETAEQLVKGIEQTESLDDAAYPAAARRFIAERLGPAAPPDRYNWSVTTHAKIVGCPPDMPS